jgi:hypothetical protein
VGDQADHQSGNGHAAAEEGGHRLGDQVDGPGQGHQSGGEQAKREGDAPDPMRRRCRGFRFPMRGMRVVRVLQLMPADDIQRGAGKAERRQ